MYIDQFRSLLHQRQILLVDGGLATELEVQGHDLAQSLWSAKVLRHDPDAVRRIHLAYYEAGADIAITASYQASVLGLVEHLQISEAKAQAIIGLSAQLAFEARAEYYAAHGPDHRQLLVAGSVGPYGAYLADGSEYRGGYSISNNNLRAFHRPRIRALIDAGVDLLAIETIPSFDEITALAVLLQEEFPTTIAWISCTLQDAKHIADGTSIEVVAGLIDAHRSQIVAFGANCISPSSVDDFILEARKFTDIPIICYPNSGESYDASSKRWCSASSRNGDWSTLVKQWYSTGASLIGGCCRTSPSDIEAIAKACKLMRATKS